RRAPGRVRTTPGSGASSGGVHVGPAGEGVGPRLARELPARSPQTVTPRTVGVALADYISRRVETSARRVPPMLTALIVALVGCAAGTCAVVFACMRVAARADREGEMLYERLVTERGTI